MLIDYRLRRGEIPPIHSACHCLWVRPGFLRGSDTCGGGSPPAPSGHSGSMVSFSLVLHLQEGEGLDGVHFCCWNRWVTFRDTEGVFQGVALLQGSSLMGNRKTIHNQSILKLIL